MADFRPLIPTERAATFAPMQTGRTAGDGQEAPAEDGFVPGFRPLIPGRMGAERVTRRVESAAPIPAAVAPAPAPAVDPPKEPEAAVEDVHLILLREEAWAAGHAAGLAAGEALIQEQVGRLDALVVALTAVRPRLMSASARDVAAAVELIAGAIVQRELAVDSSGVTDLVVSVLQHVQSDDEVVIRVAPEDERLMQSAAPMVLDRLGRDATFRIQSDSSLQPGGVTVETRLGSIDASVETRFAAFAEAVHDWMSAEVADDER